MKEERIIKIILREIRDLLKCRESAIVETLIKSNINWEIVSLMGHLNEISNIREHLGLKFQQYWDD